MYLQQLREMLPPPSQNTLEASNQITVLILCDISHKLVNLLKVTYVPIQVSDIFEINVSFKFIDLSFQTLLLFVPEMPTSFMSYTV